jgi:hypothetical protein
MWVAPAILPVALDIVVIDPNIAVKLLQDVFLPLFGLFYVCYNYPYAIELEGLISLIFDWIYTHSQNLGQFKYRW